MTPQERRERYPLKPVQPFTDEEIERLRRKSEKWLSAPTFTSSSLDITFHTYARLIATIDALRQEPKVYIDNNQIEDTESWTLSYQGGR